MLNTTPWTGMKWSECPQFLHTNWSAGIASNPMFAVVAVNAG
jgi:hypothetical protein